MSSTGTHRVSPGHGIDAARTVASAGLPEDPVVASGTDPVAEHIRAGLDRRLRVLVTADPGTRLGSDPEELHRMRVAVRRMRATLKSGSTFVDQHHCTPLLDGLDWLGRALGPVRDLDVLLGRLREHGASFPAEERSTAARLVGELESEHARARNELLAELDSERYTDLLAALAHTVRDGLPPAGSEDDGHRRLLELLGSQYRKLRKAVERVGAEATDSQLHAVRLRGKKLRYSAELAESVGGKRVRKLLRAAKDFQDVLGEHQDASVAEDRVRRLLEAFGDRGDADRAFVAGRMVEHQAARRVQCRARWWPAWQELSRRAEKL